MEVQWLSAIRDTNDNRFRGCRRVDPIIGNDLLGSSGVVMNVGTAAASSTVTNVGTLS
jgi:hypothetical protein